MLTLTRKADYAFVAMAELARRGAARSSARELAETLGVPAPVLMNVLHQLLQHGLVVSMKGSKGGYSLARPAEKISLADMIDAIQGEFRLTVCCSDGEAQDDHECEIQSNCRIRGPIRRVHQALRDYLTGVSLVDLLVEEVPVELRILGKKQNNRLTVAAAAAAAR